MENTKDQLSKLSIIEIKNLIKKEKNLTKKLRIWNLIRTFPIDFRQKILTPQSKKDLDFMIQEQKKECDENMKMWKILNTEIIKEVNAHIDKPEKKF